MADTDLNIPLTVKALRRESADCWSIVYAKPAGFQFAAGMWMDLRFPEEALAIGRTFSFASAPTEPDLLITFKTGRTPFKQRLAGVQPGEVMLITQYGSNGFHRDRTYPAVFLAGGVGIAPLRSMIKEGIDGHDALHATLIYSNHTRDFPFRRDLEAWQQTDASLHVHYVASGTAGRLTPATLGPYLAGVDVAAKYYIAGPPGMVRSAERILTRFPVAAERILTDSFTGYEEPGRVARPRRFGAP